MKLWVTEVGMEDQRAGKESANEVSSTYYFSSGIIFSYIFEDT